METKEKATTISGAAAGQIETEQNVSKVILTQTSSFLQDEILKILQENIEKAHEAALNTPQAMEHFHKRGLTDETIRRFKLGYCRVGFNKILPPNQQISKKNSPYYKYILPFLDENGAPVYCISEHFDRANKPEDLPKYYNPRGGDAPLFGEHYLRAENPPEFIFIVEGVYDAISVEQSGGAAIALRGIGHNRLLNICKERKINVNFIILGDNDFDKEAEGKENTGQINTKKLQTALEEIGIFAYVTPPHPTFKDANAHLQADSQEFQQFIEACKLQAETALYFWREKKRKEATETALAFLKINTLNDYTRERLMEGLQGNFKKYAKREKEANAKDILKNIFACLLWLNADETTILKLFNASRVRKIELVSDIEAQTALEKAREIIGERRQNLESLSKEFNIGENYFKLVDDTYDLNFPGNAERVLLLYPKRLMYVLENKRFYIWQGNYWREGTKDHEEVLPLCLKVLRFSDSIVDEVFPPDDLCNTYEIKKKNELHKFFLRSQDLKKKMIDEGVKSMGELHHHTEELDKNPWLLNTANQTIDLQTGATYKAQQEDLITRATRAEYQPYIENNLWEKIAAEIIPNSDTRRFIQKFCGYCLTDSVREHKSLFAVGIGGCGKSTFFEAIAHTIGNYAKTIPIDSLMCSRNDGDGERATPVLASMQGARLVIAGESKLGQRLNDAKFKALTGGDVQSARKLYGETFTFEPTFKLILVSNYPPALQDGADIAVKQRLIIVPFTQTFRDTERDNKSLSERLRTPEAMSEILNWLLEGLKMWTIEGLGEPPAEIKEATEIFFREADELGNFLDEYYYNTPTGKVRVGELREYFNRETEHNIRQGAFVLAMERRGYKKIEIGKRFYFLGLARREF